MLPGSWTEERRRSAFPPAPAIPTYIHLQSANERGSIIEPQSLRQPPGIDDQSTSSIHPGDSSSSPDRDPYLNELSREVQYSPSLPEHIPTNRADANFLRYPSRPSLVNRQICSRASPTPVNTSWHPTQSVTQFPSICILTLTGSRSFRWRSSDFHTTPSNQQRILSTPSFHISQRQYLQSSFPTYKPTQSRYFPPKSQTTLFHSLDRYPFPGRVDWIPNCESQEVSHPASSTNRNLNMGFKSK